MTNVHKIGFIGGGNMAEALIKGLLAGNVPAEKILVSEPSDYRRDHLQNSYVIGLADNNLELMEQSDIVVLAIKPQIAVEVLEEIAGVYSDDKLIVSILAGVTCTTIEKYFQGLHVSCVSCPILQLWSGKVPAPFVADTIPAVMISILSGSCLKLWARFS